MDYMLPAHEEFGFQCRRLLHVLLKVGRMSILIMWVPKLKMGKKIVIYHYLRRRDALHAEGTRQGRARLLAKIYEVRAFTCPKCNSEMSIISIIMDPEEIRKILQHLVKIGRSPPGINTVSLN